MTKAECKEEMTTCARSYSYWCENYVNRFEISDKQRLCMNWICDLIEAGESGIIIKDRGVDVTSMLTTFVLWRWLFHESHSAIGSFSLKVTDGFENEGSLFGMMRVIFNSLPRWMQPYCATTHPRFSNWDNNSTVAKCYERWKSPVDKKDFDFPFPKLFVLDEFTSWKYPKEDWYELIRMSSNIVLVADKEKLGRNIPVKDIISMWSLKVFNFTKE